MESNENMLSGSFNRCSAPSQLKITDVRFTDVIGAPMHCTLMKIYTNVLEEYVQDVRSVIGYDVPLAIDHFGHICVEDCIRLCRRIEKYNIAWAEDMIPK